jgi:hypothetical protein
MAKIDQFSRFSGTPQAVLERLHSNNKILQKKSKNSIFGQYVLLTYIFKKV